MHCKARFPAKEFWKQYEERKSAAGKTDYSALLWDKRHGFAALRYATAELTIH